MSIEYLALTGVLTLAVSFMAGVAFAGSIRSSRASMNNRLRPAEAGWGRDECGREVCSVCLGRNRELVSVGKPPLPLQWTLRSNGLPYCPLCGNPTKR